MTTSQYLTIIKTKPWIRIGFYTAFLLSNERISIAWLKSDILERNLKQKLENVLKTNAIADSGRELHDWNFSFSVFFNVVWCEHWALLWVSVWRLRLRLRWKSDRRHWDGRSTSWFTCWLGALGVSPQWNSSVSIFTLITRPDITVGKPGNSTH